jgi:hypothetical protein
MTERKTDRLDLWLYYMTAPLFENLAIKQPYWVTLNPLSCCIPSIWFCVNITEY